MPLVESRLSAARDQAAARFRELAGTGLATSQLEGILPAAAEERVDTLFVSSEENRWGRFDADARRLDVYSWQERGDEDLLDRAAIDTLLGRGNVYALPRSQMPADAPLCATYRY